MREIALVIKNDRLDRELKSREATIARLTKRIDEAVNDLARLRASVATGGCPMAPRARPGRRDRRSHDVTRYMSVRDLELPVQGAGFLSHFPEKFRARKRLQR